MTIGDFLNECYLYEYSMDYYNLRKEEARLMLMEAQLERAEFMVDNHDIVEACCESGMFPVSYFGESVVESELSIMESAYLEAKKNFFKWAGGELNKLWIKFKAFIKSLPTLLKSAQERIDESLKSVNLGVLTKEEGEQLAQSFKRILNSQKLGIELYEKQEAVSASPKWLLSVNDDHLRKQLASLLIGNTITVKYDSDHPYAFSLDQIDSIMNSIGKNSSNQMLLDKLMVKYQDLNMKKGIKVKTSIKELNKIISGLESRSDLLDQAGETTATDENERLSNIVKAFNVMIADTIRLYTGVITIIKETEKVLSLFSKEDLKKPRAYAKSEIDSAMAKANEVKDETLTNIKKAGQDVKEIPGKVKGKWNEIRGALSIKKKVKNNANES